ncbi:hypothetical protein Vretifemale_8739 [Volvox reticuliferus]|uniref:Uncharacterized protein n=1 Tax=Volvox reticuliferus TaxID=1737510 RepID=A0A8J4FPR7_9CHLO|nr:hypothetical protein Vretifemale_8739 [Volvox reticuliferus]
MSQIYLSPRPRPVDIAVSPVPGAVRQTSVLCYRSVGLAPASRKRLHFPCSPGNYIAQNDARDIINPAASYTPREEASAEAQARRVDDEHGATQLILLLALSVVLLTLPWIVDHPVTLLASPWSLVAFVGSGATERRATATQRCSKVKPAWVSRDWQYLWVTPSMLRLIMPGSLAQLPSTLHLSSRNFGSRLLRRRHIREFATL